MRKTFVLVLLSVVCGAGPAPARAAEFSLFTGFSTNLFLGRLVPLSSTADVPGIRILLRPESPDWAVHAGLPLGRRFTLQATVGRTGAGIVHDVGIGLAGIPLGKSKVAEADFRSFTGSLLYDFGGAKLSPYLVLGAGAATLKISEAGTKTRPLVEFGAGLKTRLSRRVRLVLDVRPALTFFRFFEDFRFAYILIYRLEARNVQTHFKARLGLAYLL